MAAHGERTRSHRYAGRGAYTTRTSFPLSIRGQYAALIIQHWELVELEVFFQMLLHANADSTGNYEVYPSSGLGGPCWWRGIRQMLGTQAILSASRSLCFSFSQLLHGRRAVELNAYPLHANLPCIMEIPKKGMTHRWYASGYLA